MKKDHIFLKKLMALVLPIALQQFMLALVSASDALMLGFLTQDALSAVSLAGQVAFIESLFLAAMTIGLSILAAQYWGKGDKTSVEKVFAFVMKVTFIISAVFFIVGLAAPEAIMRVFTPEENLIRHGATYLRVVSPSYLLTGVSQIYLCALKNTGKAKLTGAISSVSVILNIILNAALIFGLLSLPKMEIAGAALATVIARVTEVVWCIIETAKKDSVKLRLRFIFHDDKPLRRDFLKHTLPVLGNEIVWGTGFAMYSVIMGHLGSDAVAANSIANIAKNLAACFCLGVASGGGILIGNELGAGNLDTAKKYGAKLVRLAVVCGAISGGILIAIGPIIINAVSLSERAAGYLWWMFVILAFNIISYAVNCTTIAGIFCAGGDSRFGFFCDTVVMWCVSVPLGLISAFVLDLPVLAVFIIVNLDETLKIPAVFIHYRKYKWVRDLTIKTNK